MQHILSIINYLLLMCLHICYCRDRLSKDYLLRSQNKILKTQNILWKTPSLICPLGTVIRSNKSTLYNLNVISYWYPWVVHVFPRCWDALQPLLCLQIDGDNEYQTKINRPCKSICKKAISSCWMLQHFTYNHSAAYQLFEPSYNNDLLNCSSYATINCNGNYTYNKSISSCDRPLHESYDNQDIEIINTEKIYKKEIEGRLSGCSLLCDSNINIHKPHDRNVYLPIMIYGLIGLFVSTFTLLTFLIDWKLQKRYPAVILFILNGLFVMLLMGWLIQFFGVGNSIRCSPNNFRRLKGPLYPKPYWCLVSFILIYFSSTAIACWFVILTYSWYIAFKALGSTKNYICGKIKYFHLIAWSISILLTMIVIFLGGIDSHEFTDICFLGYSSKINRVIFMYIPYITSLVFGELFIICSIRVLMELHADCSLFLVPRAARNITATIRRLILYGVIMVMVVTLPIFCCIVEYINDSNWLAVYYEYVKCKIVKSIVHDHPIYYKNCAPPDSRKLFYFYVELSCLFVACIVTNSWTWTIATCRIWLKFWKKLTTYDSKQQVQISWYRRMQKKKIAPFVPPVNPANPLDANLNRKQSESIGFGVIYPLTHVTNNGQIRRNSEDIRSVLELFSARRGTKVSMESQDDSLHVPGIRRSKSVMSLQNYGHLAYRNVNQDGNLFRKMSAANIVQLKGNIENGRCSSNLTLTHLKNVRDTVFTPISLTHKDNIVADCIPRFIDKQFIDNSHSANQSLCWDQGMEPYSISSVDEVINL